MPAGTAALYQTVGYLCGGHKSGVSGPLAMMSGTEMFKWTV